MNDNEKIRVENQWLTNELVKLRAEVHNLYQIVAMQASVLALKQDGRRPRVYIAGPSAAMETAIKLVDAGFSPMVSHTNSYWPA